MKKLLSYFWPIRKKVSTDYSGNIEILWINGKPFLNAQNATYSFGNLQRILEAAVSDMDFSSVKNILILGLGGGSIVNSLREKFNHTGKITCVEIDKKMIGIAKREFSLLRFSNVYIENEDAFDFVKHHNDIFDLIIVDVFIDITVPKKFYTQEFLQNIDKLLSPNSRLVFNMGIGDIGETVKNNVVAFFKKSGSRVKLFENFMGANVVLIANRP